MERREYSAGAVKMSFWFSEFRKVVTLLDEGNSIEDVKEMNWRENIFSAPTPTRANQIFSTVSGRIRCLDSSFYPIFLASDLAAQKLFALIGAMAYDTLFFDFVYEVLREKIIIGTCEVSDSDVRVFFKNKQLQDEKVAGWTDETLARLGRSYQTMLYEAGVIDKSKPAHKISRPILTPELHQWLLEQGMELFINALTGVDA